MQNIVYVINISFFKEKNCAGEITQWTHYYLYDVSQLPVTPVWGIRCPLLAHGGTTHIHINEIQKEKF